MKIKLMDSTELLRLLLVHGIQSWHSFHDMLYFKMYVIYNLYMLSCNKAWSPLGPHNNWDTPLRTDAHIVYSSN